MATTKFTEDVDIVQGLSNKPNEIEGLTADQLKKKFDDNSINFKTYINETLTEEIDTAAETQETRNLAIETRLTTEETNVDNLQLGWTLAGETWTYASVDDPTGVITISGDKTSKYSLGMRIKFTNATNVVYGIITAISYSSPNTTLTFLHEIDPTDSLALHLMEDSAITLNYYSTTKTPFGFPLSRNKWSVIAASTSDISQTTSGTTIYNLGSFGITIPIGLWNIKYKILPQIGNAAATAGAKYMTVSLSTVNNTLVGANAVSIAGADVKFIRNYIEKAIDNLSLAVKTQHYITARDDAGTGNTIYILGTQSVTYIIAECAYL